METTIRGKQNDFPPPGSRPPPLQPSIVNPVVDTASDESETNFDGISWLDGDSGLAEEFRSVSGNRFELDECGIDLRSAWLRDVISSAPMQPRQSTSTPDLPTASSSSQIVPSASAWEEWE